MTTSQPSNIERTEVDGVVVNAAITWIIPHVAWFYMVVLYLTQIASFFVYTTASDLNLA